MDIGLARVTSTSILVIGLIIVVFATGSADNNYATVEFDGGYSQIGIIYGERVTSEAAITFEDEDIVSGDIDDVIAWIQDNSDDSDIWVEGVSLSASTSISWIASRQDFELKTDSYVITSDGTLPPLLEIEKLEAMLSKAHTTREFTSSAALTFSKDPNSGLAGQLISLLK